MNYTPSYNAQVAGQWGAQQQYQQQQIQDQQLQQLQYQQQLQQQQYAAALQARSPGGYAVHTNPLAPPVSPQQLRQLPPLTAYNGYSALSPQSQQALLPPLRAYSGRLDAAQPSSPLSPAARALSGYAVPPQHLQQPGSQQNVYAALRQSQLLQQQQQHGLPHPLAPPAAASQGGYPPAVPAAVAAANAATAAQAAVVAQQNYYTAIAQQQQMQRDQAMQVQLQQPMAPPSVQAASYLRTPPQQQQMGTGVNPGAAAMGMWGVAGAATAAAPGQQQYGMQQAAGAAGGGMELQAPVQQQAMLGGNLESLPGVVIKETSQVVDAIMQASGGAYESANKYHVRALPPNVRPATEHNQPGTWLPTGREIDLQPEVYYVEEDSSCCSRVCLTALGCLNYRGLKLHFYQGANKSGVEVERPCKLGATCCCPLEMTIREKGEMVGMVVEDPDSCCRACVPQCCSCTHTQKVMMGKARESLVHKYSLVNPTCCCGRVNNCCGATCCKPNFFIDIHDPTGKLLTVVQKTYGAGGAEDCCRMANDFSNYVVPFPPGSSHHERLALVIGVLSLEYAYHSRTGAEDGGDNS